MRHSLFTFHQAETSKMTQGKRFLMLLLMATMTSLFISTVCRSQVIEGGERHSLVLCSGGSVTSTGYNGFGALGDGTTTTRLTPVTVSGLSGITSISAGRDYGLALKNDGTVSAWGYNQYGALGDGTTITRLTPVQVIGLTEVTSVSAGFVHSLALKQNGTVWAWGYNNFGQLGDGTYTQRLTPIQIPGLSGITAISAGGLHSLGLKNDGTVWEWGGWMLGSISTTPVQVGGLSGIIAVSAGAYYSLALKNDGTVWAWGSNNYGQLGDGTTTSRSVPFQILGLSGITAISASFTTNLMSHSLALRNDGIVRAWGYNFNGQLGDGTTTNRLSPVHMKLGPIPDAANLPIVTGECPGPVTITSIPTATLCGSATTIYGTTSDPLTYTAQGTYTVHWSYDDGYGNITTQNQTVIVQDVTPPVAVAHNITVELTSSGKVTVTPEQIDNGSTDNCGIASLSLSGNTGVVCATANQWDYLYLQAPEGAIFTSIDFASFGTPEGSCGSFTIGDCHAANSMAVVSGYAIGQNAAWIYVDNWEFDYYDCWDNLRLYVQARYTWTEFVPYDCSNIGTNAITLKVTDFAGNVGTSTATVTVEDNSDPVITGPSSIAIASDPGLCGAVVHIPILKDVIYGTDWDSGTIFEFEKTTLEVVESKPMTISGISTSILRTHGLSLNPITGAWYAVVGYEGASGMVRSLVTLDPATGNGSLIGETGLNIAGIAFSNVGVLYAVSGASGPGANKLYTLNLSTGIPTYVKDVSPGGGKGFAFNPDDGMFYHKFYNDPDHGFEKFYATTTSPLIPITLSGDWCPHDVTSLTYEGSGVFLMNGRYWNRITTGGSITLLDEGPDWMKGLAFNTLHNAVMVIDNCAFTITQSSGLPSGNLFPVGTTTNTYVATDASSNSASLSIDITVNDIESPVIVPLSGPITFVKDNINNCNSNQSNYVELDISSLYTSLSDNCSATIKIAEVSSDEPEDAAGNWDGCTEEDIDLHFCDKVELRKECDTRYDGRVYRIKLEARDPSDNTSTAYAYVHIKKTPSSSVTWSGAVNTVSCGSPKRTHSVATVPQSVTLSQNFPNPFNPTTSITYGIPEDGYVLLRVFDVHGRVVSTLVNEARKAGTYSVEFDGSALPSGVYLYRLEANGQVRTMTMALVK